MLAVAVISSRDRGCARGNAAVNVIGTSDDFAGEAMAVFGIDVTERT